MGGIPSRQGFVEIGITVRSIHQPVTYLNESAMVGETYPKVETLGLGPDDLTVHEPDYTFHLFWIFVLLEPGEISQKRIDH